MEVSGKKRDPTKGYSRSAVGVNAQIYCDPCCKDGIKLTAHGFCKNCMEHLCESCYKTHRKRAPCRNHVLLGKSQMPKTQSSGHLKVPKNDLTKQCRLHKGKLIEYICHDHNIFGCSPCITLNHRNCKVDYISDVSKEYISDVSKEYKPDVSKEYKPDVSKEYKPDVSKEYKPDVSKEYKPAVSKEYKPDVSKEYRTSDEYREPLPSLAALQKQFQKIIEETKANKKKILQHKSFVKDEIKKFHQEINVMFDKLEASLEKRANDIFTKESTRMESLALNSVKLEKDIEQLRNDISKLETANQCNAPFIRSKENKETIQSYTSAEEQAHKDNYVNSFTPNVDLKEILESETGNGELQKSDIVRNVKTDAGYFNTLCVTYSDEINVKSPTDDSDCCILGAVFIAKHRIAFVDSINCAVKIVDTKTKKITCEKKLSESLSNLDLLPDGLLAVSFSCSKMITFLSIANGLSEVRHLEVDGWCNDLVYHDNRLIVTFKFYDKVHIMDLDGNIYQSIKKDFYGNEFEFPYVTVGVGKFYISDYSTNTITSMNLNGEVLKGYKDERLLAPCGMVVLDDGSILVCSSGNNKILLISENLETTRVILEGKDGLYCPWSLALDRDKNNLYVGSGKFCNFLKVYDLNEI
ncbi:uncharacterized protein LOC132721306 [Ruditapes philippinarum]|uniref:uncharacterized protein LOC132721306 n=1 Tax=Ruditapes philippinarum TaxID=129788 RepID=UPI00295B6A8B|nr:uncharacterized protein LOC132721306 [Ruditapes philippinarum]